MKIRVYFINKILIYNNMTTKENYNILELVDKIFLEKQTLSVPKLKKKYTEFRLEYPRIFNKILKENNIDYLKLLIETRNKLNDNLITVNESMEILNEEFYKSYVNPLEDQN